MASRLPVVGGDTSAWGATLNDYLTKTVGQVPGSSRVFYLDAYGADASGSTLSDSAWTACYADAAAAVQSTVARSGSMIVLGAGVYKFSTNTVAITDGRIGLRGQGKWATAITTTGTSGDLVYITDNTGTNGQAAPVSGFTCWGWQSGNPGVNGVRYGSRSPGTMTDVKVYGFTGTNSKGFWFIDDLANSLSERSFFQLDADQNTINYSFDGSASAKSSHDYSHMYLGTNSLTNGVATTALQFVNNAHMVGGFLQLSGNMNSNNASWTGTMAQVGNSGSDTAHITSSQFMVACECDGSTGTVRDFVLNGASGAGIIHCNGIMQFINNGGSWTAGSVSGSAVFTHAGYMNAPLFSSHGTLTALGTGGTLSTYSG